MNGLEINRENVVNILRKHPDIKQGLGLNKDEKEKEIVVEALVKLCAEVRKPDETIEQLRAQAAVFGALPCTLMHTLQKPAAETKALTVHESA
jgi:hypothetical protein